MKGERIAELLTEWMAKNNIHPNDDYFVDELLELLMKDKQQNSDYIGDLYENF